MSLIDVLKQIFLKKEEKVSAELPKEEKPEAKPTVAKIRPLDLLNKLEKLDELDVKVDHIKTRANLILEALAKHNTDVLDRLVKLDELDKLDEISLTLKERLRPTLEKATEEIKLTFKLQKILDVFKDRKILSTKEVALIFNTSKATASKQLKTLEKLGLIQSVGAGIYELIPESNEAKL
jgi:uncharacterized membrane protein